MKGDLCVYVQIAILFCFGRIRIRFKRMQKNKEKSKTYLQITHELSKSKLVFKSRIR